MNYKRVAALIGGLAFIYLLGAFVAVSFNLTDWTSEGRSVTAFGFAVVAFAALTVPIWED